MMEWNALPDGDLIVTLYFTITKKLDRTDGPRSMADDEWARFLIECVEPVFKTGFTVLEGIGQYHHAAGKRVARNLHTKVLVVTATKWLGPEIDGIRKVGQRRFQQTSVGLTVVSCHADFDPVPDPEVRPAPE
jgi:hypothetical protein